MRSQTAAERQARRTADPATQSTPPQQQHPEVAAAVRRQLRPGASLLVPGFEIGACLLASDGIGGDFFDFIELPDQRVGIAVGDASGRGIASELLMAKAQRILRDEAGIGGETVASINKLNQALNRDSRPEDFVTLFYGVASGTNQLRYVNAGHPRALLVRCGGTLPLPATGRPLGLFADAVYEEACVPLGPGDLLLIYSDGVTDAQSPAGPFFDEGGMQAVLRGHQGQQAHEIARLICDAAEHFERGSLDPTDDKTVVVVRVVDRSEAG